MLETLAPVRSKRAAALIGFWWGFAEGIAFFIVPDVYIYFLVLFEPRRSIRAWLFAILGGLTAVTFSYIIYTYTSFPIAGFLAHIPGIHKNLITQTVSQVSHGLPYNILLPNGIIPPLKVYAFAAFSAHLPLLSVLLWTVFNRIVRVAPGVLLAALIKFIFRSSFQRYPDRWLVLYAFAWTAFYILYIGYYLQRA